MGIKKTKKGVKKLDGGLFSIVILSIVGAIAVIIIFVIVCLNWELKNINGGF